MKVRKVYSHMVWKWRWDAAGLFGYCVTKQGALRAARRALMDLARG